MYNFKSKVTESLDSNGSRKSSEPVSHWRLVPNPEAWKNIPIGLSPGQDSISENFPEKAQKIPTADEKIKFDTNDGFYEVRLSPLTSRSFIITKYSCSRFKP